MVVGPFLHFTTLTLTYYPSKLLFGTSGIAGGQGGQGGQGFVLVYNSSYIFPKATVGTKNL